MAYRPLEGFANDDEEDEDHQPPPHEDDEQHGASDRPGPFNPISLHASC